MKISIIIPAFNEEKLIGETIQAVNRARHAFSSRQWETELIVCDNNSNDRTGDIARAEGAKVVFEPLNQIARARNSGAAAATGDWLIFIDADSRPSPELFEAVADQIKKGRCIAGGATVKLEGHYPIGNRVISFWNFVSRTLKWVAGSFIFCEAVTFRKIGGFSNELFAAEELELSRRLKQFARQTGKKIVILSRHPLLTSARKMHLYSAREHFVFLSKTVLVGGRTLKNRASCPTWYDGRR